MMLLRTDTIATGQKTNSESLPNARERGICIPL